MTSKSYIADVSADVFARVARFTAQGDIRRSLNGVRIIAGTNGGPVTLLSSNGYMLYAEEDLIGTASRSFTVALPSGVIRRRFTDEQRVRVTEDGTLTIFSVAKRDGGCIYHHPVPAFIEATFPDFHLAIGNPAEYEDGLRGDFNPDLLLRAVELTHQFGTAIRFYSARPPAQRIAFVMGGGLRGGGRGKAFGMVMPMKSGMPDGLEANMPEALRARHGVATQRVAA